MPRPLKAKSAAKDSTVRLGVNTNFWLGFQPPDIALRFDEVTANLHQSRTLATLRDTAAEAAERGVANYHLT